MTYTPGSVAALCHSVGMPDPAGLARELAAVGIRSTAEAAPYLRRTLRRDLTANPAAVQALRASLHQRATLHDIARTAYLKAAA
jgi:hypothetical protein